ncbi:MAG: type IV pilus modification protein PilV [Magnetococcales bacterium]|nr:type IV pilus modification protein PilV [Magnetococcales bacterium]
MMGGETDNRQSGFTLLEILIALIILVIGTFAVVKLQMTSRSSNYDSMQRGIAGILVHDITERMRANNDALESYEATDLGSGSLGSEPSPGCTNSLDSCSGSQLAAHDLWEWEQLLDGASELSAGGNSTGGLLKPTACIAGPGGGVSGTYTVAIAWRGKRALSNPTSTTCGEGSGNYGASDEFRRVMVLDTYISTAN